MYNTAARDIIEALNVQQIGRGQARDFYFIKQSFSSNSFFSDLATKRPIYGVIVAIEGYNYTRFVAQMRALTGIK